MLSAIWALALIGGATFVVAALVYGALTNRRCDLIMEPSKQEKADELAMRKEWLSE